MHEKKNSYVLYAIAIAAIVMAAVSLSLVAAKAADRGVWKCSAANCTQYVAGEEWAARFCTGLTNDDVCPVNVNGQIQQYSLGVLRQGNVLANMKECVEFKCIQETYARPADYAIEQPS